MARLRKAKTVAVIGYGPQGKAISLNLRDSGYKVVVGLRSGSRSRTRVRRDKLSPANIPGAVRAADIVCFAFPDHLHGRVFKTGISPHLKPGATLWFLHSTSVHFGFIKPPKPCDIILVAPHAPGKAVRDEYLTDRSLSGFYGVHQNRSRRASATAVELAQAIGIRKKNLVRTSFAQESVGDLFGEQAVLCGGLAMLVKSGFETLLKHGWKAENAYLEVAYQLDLIVALMKAHGIEGMFARISPAAQYGSLLAGPKIIDTAARKRMDKLFREIESGAFARKLSRLDDQSVTKLRTALKKLSNPKLEKAARKFSR